MMNVSAWLVAQNIGEYGGLGAAMVDGVSQLRFLIEDRLGSMTPANWAVAAGGLFLLWLVFRHRR